MLTADKIKPCDYLPHSAAMCLIQEVVCHDPESIVCSASSHRDLTNPLRSNNRLSAINAVEYAAQAMAIHAGCVYQSNGETSPLKGFLASVRELTCYEQYLDHLLDDLIVTASRHALVADGFSYRFEIRSRDKLVMKGRLSIRVLRGV